MIFRKSNPIICLIGPTGSGKTNISIKCSEYMPIEIISIDSALVYKYMDIGTAKPSKKVLDSIPHHLVDIIEPTDTYSVYRFYNYSLEIINKILFRGNIPLFVGGSFFYYKVLMYGINLLPESNKYIRNKIYRFIKKNGLTFLYLFLSKIDIKTYMKISCNDFYRIQRAIEVFVLTGYPISILLSRKKYKENYYNFITISLNPSDRNHIYKIIEDRFNLMLDNGFINEVEELRKIVGLNIYSQSMRCIGYKQIWKYLDNDINYLCMKKKSIIATRQLCKRQLTWLRSFKVNEIVDCCKIGYLDKVINLINNYYYN